MPHQMPSRTGSNALSDQEPPFDAIVVVGAGQAGLGMSHALQKLGLSQLILERGRIGESWCSQRWDSFRVNTPNALNALPGAPYDGTAADGFCSAAELAESFERYATRFNLPMRTGVEVVRVEAEGAAGPFRVHVRTKTGTREELRARNVVIASGANRAPRVPPFASKLPRRVLQVHAAAYRNPAALPEGAVLVVGGGQSGCQIAEDLIEAGRRVYLCTSKVGRIPRRYRGRDIDEWLWDAGFFDLTRADLDDPSAWLATQPQVSGVGRYGRTISLQQLARGGVTLLGRLIDVEGADLVLADDLTQNIRFADRKSADLRREIDTYIARNGVSAPAPEDDLADRPWPEVDAVTAPTRLDIDHTGVGAVVWCTGFTADFSWIRLPVVDGSGRPVHDRGVSPVRGLYFVGLPWLHKSKSGLICGVEEDAAFIARDIASRIALVAA